jgi:hypothetical protein
MRSLFIVSLPRSLSSFTFQVCRIVLGLEEPVWTSDGEILNLDRFAFAQAEGAGWKFKPGGTSDSCFERMKRFLDQAVAPEGFIYKDVVQPFLVSDWLRRKDLAMLRIERDLAEVACSMLARQWFYPERAAELPGSREERVIEGLVRASAALDALEGVPVIRYEELVSDEQALWRKLSELYPDCAVPRFTYIDDRFRHAREAAMARRETSRFREIAEKVQGVVSYH